MLLYYCGYIITVCHSDKYYYIDYVHKPHLACQEADVYYC